jgi:Tol biopolymer transport system component
MGGVYPARDARLQRDVAIKVLPAAFTNDRERLARFEREAQVLASLNHPHIAQVYGLLESGPAPALVMELVEGPTLSEVIASSPLPLTRALTIARQIADGLEAAHEKGIVHRDLKPGNVALTHEGDVKILDFGVAKSLVAATPDASRDAASTDVGVLLGTPAYMSPEQARGFGVDKRTDIWAFGCLLYELLARRQAFPGMTSSDSLAAVLEREPDMTRLPVTTPSSVRSLLRHCLQKDPKGRLRDIADARLIISDALNQPPDRARGAEIGEPDSTHLTPRAAVLWVLAGVAVVAAAAIGLSKLQLAPRSVDPPRRTLASIVLPRGLRLGGSDLEAQASESRFAVSPDGRRLAVIAAEGAGRARLWVRDLASPAFQPVPQTENASFPFWAPDSQSIGFVAAGKLKTVRLSDGTSITVNDAGFRLATWGSDDLILFAPARASPLYIVPASGGAPTPVTTLDAAKGEVQHGYPAFLPDRRHFLYFSIGTVSGGLLDPRGIYVGSLAGTEAPKLLLPRVTQARFASGHILFVQDGTLMAQPFDVGSRELRAAAFPLIEEIKLPTTGATGGTAAFSVSDTGVLAYQAALRTQSRPIEYDRAGREVAALADSADYGEVQLSPDGTQLATSVTDPARSTRDIWLYDVKSGRGQRATFEPGDEFAPVWSPDGRRLLFSALTRAVVNLQLKDLVGGEKPATIDTDNLGVGRYAADWSRDGRHIMYIGGGRAISRSELWTASVANPRDARALLESGFVETHGRFAPGGRWFAYASNESGQLEVYVDRFPIRGAKHTVSTSGGRWPRWSRDGRELFYVGPGNQLMTVPVRTTGDRVTIGTPRLLFTLRPRPPVRLDAYPYDVSPDGQRFVVNTLVEDTSASTITLVLNWVAGLPRR